MKLFKKVWDNCERITADWYSFLGWTILWSAFFIVAIYEIFYVKSSTFGFLLFKICFAIVTLFSSVLLILYIFKKCYAISEKFFPPGKSKLLWVCTFIEAVALCFLVVFIMSMIAFTLKTIPGLSI